jgi:hypothetical protein
VRNPRRSQRLLERIRKHSTTGLRMSAVLAALAYVAVLVASR